MKHLQKVCLIWIILGGFLYGLDGIFQLDLLGMLEIRFPILSACIKILFAAGAMVSLLLINPD